MGVMAFQSLSMHCQCGRIDFLRIPALGGKQTALPSRCRWAHAQTLDPLCPGLTGFPCSRTVRNGFASAPRSKPYSFFLCFPSPLRLSPAGRWGHLASELGMRLSVALTEDPLPGEEADPTPGALPGPLGHSNRRRRTAGIPVAPRPRLLRRALPLHSLEFQNLEAIIQHVSSHWGNF